MKGFDARLLRLAPGARRGVVALAALGTLAGLAAIGQALAVAHLVFVVVRGLPAGSAIACALAAFAVRGSALAATEVVAARTGVAVSTELRHALAARILGSGLHGLRRHSSTGADTSTTASPLTLTTQGATSVEPYVARYLPALVAATVLPVATIVAMAFLDLRTALIPLFTLPLLPLFAALIGYATKDATDRRWQALSQLSGHFLDVMKGLPTLVGYSRAHRQSATIRAVSDDHRRATVETLRIAFLSSAALEFLATISVALVAVTTGLLLATGGMELDVALGLILLAPEAYWPIRRVGAEFHNAADGAAALDDIAAVLLDEAPSQTSSRPRDDAPAPNGATVHARGLTYRHADDLPAVLCGLDLDIRPGLTVLTGPSGAGKTTLLELIAGLRTPTDGTLHAPAAHLLTQRPFLAPASMRDNLLLGATGSPTDADLHAVLARVALTDLLDTLPEGLDTRLGDDGFGLSAGQRARFALARVLLSDAPLVLLDEPTAHLDPETETVIGGVIRDLADHRTVVAVAHRPHLLEIADAHIDLAPALRGGTP